jgi:hypothetical protein
MAIQRLVAAVAALAVAAQAGLYSESDGVVQVSAARPGTLVHAPNLYATPLPPPARS